MTSTRQKISQVLAMRYEELTESLRLELMERAMRVVLNYREWGVIEKEITALWSEIHVRNIAIRRKREAEKK